MYWSQTLLGECHGANLLMEKLIKVLYRGRELFGGGQGRYIQLYLYNTVRLK